MLISLRYESEVSIDEFILQKFGALLRHFFDHIGFKFPEQILSY